MSTIRKAARADLDAVCRIYDQIHTAEERGEAAIGWQRGVYPERETAEAALTRGDLFVQEQDGEIVGTAILNQTQVDSYAGANWRHDAPDSEVMVLHTLVIDPEAKSRGLGREFAAFLRGLCPRARLPVPSHRHERAQCARPPLLSKARLRRDRRRAVHV